MQANHPSCSGRSLDGRSRRAEHPCARTRHRRLHGPAPAIRQRRLLGHDRRHHHRRTGHLRPRDPRHDRPHRSLDRGLRSPVAARGARDIQPGRLRPRPRALRHRTGRHHPGRQPGPPDSRRGRPPQAAERSRALRHLQLHDLYQDGARPDEPPPLVPQQAVAAQLRIHIQLHGHLGAHRRRLPSGHDLRIVRGALPQPLAAVPAPAASRAWRTAKPWRSSRAACTAT